MNSRKGMELKTGFRRAVQITARYAAGVFHIIHGRWFCARGYTKPYKPWERKWALITVKGKRKRRRIFLKDGVVSEDVRSKLKFERERHGS